MKMPLRKKSPMIKIINSSLIDLPSPSNISTMWNFGSMLGLCLTIQLITGVFLSMNYCPNTEMAFNSVIHISRDINYGWLMRNVHANGASMFFMCMYMHIGRGIYYSSFKMLSTWMIGVTIMFITMAAAFLGYVLPWGQMSFWGATVITNLLSAIPYLGPTMVQWIWGGFAIDNATLSRFFSLHFLLPFIIAAMVMIHLLFLHQTGSNNPMGLNSNVDKMPFHPYFSMKDSVSVLMVIIIMTVVSTSTPYYLSDPDNFTPSNPLVTPIHIQPEWYFLFAYAILRSIPNKLGGVLALVASIAILYTLPMTKKNFLSTKFYPLSKSLFWMLTATVILLTWIGARPVEAPFVQLGQVLTMIYFSYFMLTPILYKTWEMIIK